MPATDQYAAGSLFSQTYHEPILELHKLEKRYTGTHALKPADLAFRAGEIHAIVGENGAGKSTLIKLLTGVTPRTAGEIIWKGKPTDLSTPNEAIALGINAVHQEVVLCPHLSVAANIFLGDEETSYGLLRAARHGARRAEDPRRSRLRPAGRRAALQPHHRPAAADRDRARGDARHAVPHLRRADRLSHAAGGGAALRADPRLKQQGVTIVYISHRMEEIFELADRVSVLRDGMLVGTREVSETNEVELISMMINRTIEQVYHKDEFTIGAPILETRNLSGAGFEDVSLTVHEGEIVGLYGLIGAGRSEFVMGVYGRQPITSGEVLWQGRPVRIRNERDAIDLGIALAPESRRDQGLCLNLGVGLNLNLPIFDRLTRGLTISPHAGARGRQPADRRSPDQDREPQRAGAQPVGRQPAEDRDRQMAEPRGQALHLRRAHRGRRCRHQGRDLPPLRRAALQGGGHPADLVLPAGGLRAVRPAARAARRDGRSPATPTRPQATNRF